MMKFLTRPVRFNFRRKREEPRPEQASAPAPSRPSPFSGLFRKAEEGMIKLDKSLDQRKPSELMMIYAMPVLLFGYLAVQFLIPAGEKLMRQRDLELKNVTQNIRLYEGMVTSRKEGSAYIEELKVQNGLLKESFAKEKRKADFIDYRLVSAPELAFDRAAWARLLDKLAEEADRRELNLWKIANEERETPVAPGTFGRLQDLVVEGSGNYPGLLAFLAFAESYGLLSVEESLLQGSEAGEGAVAFKLRFAVWGIRQ